MFKPCFVGYYFIFLLYFVFWLGLVCLFYLVGLVCGVDELVPVHLHFLQYCYVAVSLPIHVVVLRGRVCA